MTHSGNQIWRKKCSIILSFVSLGKDWEFAVYGSLPLSYDMAIADAYPVSTERNRIQ
jgi:hypothetical protein